MSSPSDPVPFQRTVLKFGGSSVSDRSAWDTIAAILRNRLKEGRERLLVVHSALQGVTDELDALAGGEKAALEVLLRRHREFARELLGHVPPELEPELAELEALAGEAASGPAPSPSHRARILSMGERMATRVSAAFLASQGLPVRWLDARELLTAPDPRQGAVGGGSEAHGWLSAECSAEEDPELRARLDGLEGFGLTQGFTAATPTGETVVLGRGGSDTAAAYLVGRWGGDRLEIWSDVPGMFTADPHRIPSARLLRRLSYAEAQEIATTGSRVLHPRCIPALRERGIPIHLKSTRLPHVPGTVIQRSPPDGAAQLKAVSWKRDVILLSMETVGMWQEVGFLARASAVLAEAGLSVDLVSTSETNVTVSLDAAANLLEPERLEGVQERLGEFCRVEIIQPCAAVSLVGRRIRGMLHRLAPALRVFQEHRIHMVSQAASDLNFTVVVDEDQGERLARQLHRLLLSEPATPGVLGPSWGELTQDAEAGPRDEWWVGLREALLAHLGQVDAAYVYHPDTARARVDDLQALAPISRVFYAMKANPNPAILRVMEERGLGFECVSRGEIERIQGLFPDLDPDRILFTPNFAPRSEYAFALDAGVHMTLDALHPVEHWPELFRGQEVFLRLDPGQGAGHHEKVTTAGSRSKFGIPVEELDALDERLRAVDARVVGLHVHAGSGILTADHWPRMARFLLEVAPRFPHLKVLDLGGGLPVPQAPGEVPLELDRMEAELEEAARQRPDLELWLEPGRFLVAEAGVLLARVTQTKNKAGIAYVGLATGMNSLIRPALYGSYHEIVNLTRLDDPAAERVQVVGPICETGDRLGMDRLLPSSREGDLVLIADAGAYGRAMASEYNLRPPATEFLISGDGRISPAR
jgi:bifunctional diaminopimelate decarboxylase / aspartate kinase